MDDPKNLLTEEGFKEVACTGSFARYSSPSVYHYDVDVLIVDEHSLKSMLEKSRQFESGHAVFRVPCAEHMIQLKLHAMKNNPRREFKDIGDVVSILRNTPSINTGEDLKELCNRYAPAGVYEKIMEAL